MSAPDFRAEVVDALRPCNEADRETCLELADHLSEMYEERIISGSDLAEAKCEALLQLGNSSRLRREIRRAQGGGMGDSFSKVLLPGVVSTFAVGVYSIIFEQYLGFHAQAGFFWGQAAFVSYWYMVPAFLMGGMIGAGYSRFKGGSVRQRLNAGLFMAILSLCIIIVPFLIALFHEGNVEMSLKFQALAGYLLSQVIVPGIPMLIGTMPFLGKSKDVHQDLASA